VANLPVTSQEVKSIWKSACCHYSAVLVCVARGEIELKSVSFGAIDRERGSGANLDPRRWAKNALHYAAQRTEHR
jgi:hypothetical protein